MKNCLFFPLFVLILILQGAPARSQQLSIQTDAAKTTIVTRADLDALPHVKITTNAPGGSTAFEGVSLKAVLEKAGVGFGETMRGKRLASYLLVEAADEYRVIIALPEIDPAFTDKQFILVFLKDGKPLDGKEGPYRIVIPDEKRMARWVRQVTTLKIMTAP